ncbi:MAG: hypothetical protein AAGM38_12260 [Pseudomonadota bacterium]
MIAVIAGVGIAEAGPKGGAVSRRKRRRPRALGAARVAIGAFLMLWAAGCAAPPAATAPLGPQWVVTYDERLVAEEDDLAAAMAAFRQEVGPQRRHHLRAVIESSDERFITRAVRRLAALDLPPTRQRIDAGRVAHQNFVSLRSYRVAVEGCGGEVERPRSASTAPLTKLGCATALSRAALTADPYRLIATEGLELVAPATGVVDPVFEDIAPKP